eukprot:312034-Alexandrium_andersonii.AAC.1
MASCAHSPVSPASSQWSESVSSEMDSSSESSYARSYFVWKRCLKMASPKALGYLERRLCRGRRG